MSKENNCAGSYPVSGYTRADGTKVSGYTRTCGAAHASTESTTGYTSADSEISKKEQIIRKDEVEREKMQRCADILYPTMSDNLDEIEGLTGEDGINKNQKNSEIKNIQAVHYFIKNYLDMKEANTIGADKYFHAKANCQAGQVNGVAAAIMIDTLRELTDFFLLNPTKQILDKNKKLDIKANFEDSLKDFEANLYGLKKGKENPNINCSYLVDKYRPNRLDEKY